MSKKEQGIEEVIQEIVIRFTTFIKKRCFEVGYLTDVELKHIQDDFLLELTKVIRDKEKEQI